MLPSHVHEKISDIKMIDIWLIFCQLVPFAQVVLLTAMEYIREEEKEEREEEKVEDTLIVRGQEIELDIKEVELNIEGEPNTKNAWTPTNTEPGRNNAMHNLLTIGKDKPTCYYITSKM